MTNREPVFRRGHRVLWRRSYDTVLVLPPGAVSPLSLSRAGSALWDLLYDWSTADELARELGVESAHGVDAALADMVRATVVTRQE